MKTCGVSYIGSKAALLPHITRIVSELCPGGGRLIDVMTGTTRVAQAFKALGWSVVTSDLAWASQCYADAFLNDAPREHLHELEEFLNGLEGADGWITQTYCDVPGQGGGAPVRVWQPRNGRRADAIRDWIAGSGLGEADKRILVASLICALDRTQNTCGIQMAYLKAWNTRSLTELQVRVPRVQGPPSATPHLHLVGDCLTLQYPEADVAYVDPPYSAHSYASYYHIWDSIARWDKPRVGLATNRRMDRVYGKTGDCADAAMRSPWNSKASVRGAFERLFARLPVRYIVLSYSCESLLPLEELLELCRRVGVVEAVHDIPYKRNIMSTMGNPGRERKSPRAHRGITEHVIVIRKDTEISLGTA